MPLDGSGVPGRTRAATPQSGCAGKGGVEDVSAATTDPFVHPALFYRDEQEYLAGTLPFLEAGLAAGEPVAVAVPGANLRLIREGLGPAAEAVLLLDMQEAGRNPGRIIPGVLRAFADAQPSGRRVRIIGEPIWAAAAPPSTRRAPSTRRSSTSRSPAARSASCAPTTRAGSTTARSPTPTPPTPWSSRPAPPRSAPAGPTTPTPSSPPTTCRCPSRRRCPPGTSTRRACRPPGSTRWRRPSGWA